MFYVANLGTIFRNHGAHEKRQCLAKILIYLTHGRFERVDLQKKMAASDTYF